MGWVYTTRPSGNIDNFFDKEFISDNYEFVGKGYLVNLTEYYRAMKNKKTGKIFALVCLVDVKNKWEIGYKDMTEDVGPYCYNCPKKVLDVLTEPINDYAKEWRKKCYKVLERKNKAKTLKHGDIIRFANKIQFVSGVEHDTFMIVVWKNSKRLYMVYENGSVSGQVKIRNWKNLDYEIITDKWEKEVQEYNYLTNNFL